jgi:hypothetical protein
MTIFVGIPSYRDPELLPTLHDCMAKARWPDDLRIGLCWQHDAAESLGRFADDRRFRIVDVPFPESRAVVGRGANTPAATKVRTSSFNLIPIIDLSKTASLRPG